MPSRLEEYIISLVTTQASGQRIRSRLLVEVVASCIVTSFQWLLTRINHKHSVILYIRVILVFIHYFEIIFKKITRGQLYEAYFVAIYHC